MKRGRQSDSTCKCDLCTCHTQNDRDPIFLFYDPKRDMGDRIVRGHLKCLMRDALEAFRLAGHWEVS